AECVIVLSTIYVFGQPRTETLADESWPYAPVGGEYGRSKAKMERWCLRRAASSHETRIVVVNPSCVYGEGGKTYTRMPVEMARARTFCWIDDGQGIANYTYVDNVVDATLLAARCPLASGKRFIISDGFCSWREFLTPLLGPLADGLVSYSTKQL